MLEFLRDLLFDYYIYIKFIHILFVMMWAFSTFVGASSYLYPIFVAWRRNPDDKELIPMRNWVMERFDEGVIYEHIAFPVVIITGLLLFIVGGWDTTTHWLNLKVLIVLGVFIPMEVYDYYLSHFGGNKEKIRHSGDMTAYEKAIHSHWWFLLITTPGILIFVSITLFLAIVKPVIGG